MRRSEYSSVNSANGNVTWKGPLSQEKGDHSGMPPRTEAYLPGDEKGHVNASSLGGDNTASNVVPQHHDLNHGGYLSIENGERKALQNGASIESVKTAIVDGQPGERPTTFQVNDTVTYADGHLEKIHNSFTNESNANQVEWNDMSSALTGIYDAPNPGDDLRELMSLGEYTNLMELTDAEMVTLEADYAPSDFYGVPYATSGNDVSENSIRDADIDAGIDAGIDVDIDDGIDVGLDF